MANVRKRISELTPLTSASLDTTIVGVDNGVTYKIELDTLADAVTSRVNILDRDRLVSLESVTSSFETKGRSIISSSAQITSLGFVSSSTDITLLNAFTSSQSTLNTTFTNGINARLQTSSFNEYTASISTASLVTSISNLNSATSSYLTSLSGAISSSSQLTSSFDERYTLSGSILSSFSQSVDSRLDNLENEISSSVSYAYVTYITEPEVPNDDANRFLKPDGNVSGSISYNQSTGYFTLLAGKTYKLRAVVNMSGGPAAFSPPWNLQWKDTTNNVYIGTQSIFRINVPNESYAIITPNTNILVGLSSLANPENGHPYIIKNSTFFFIEEMALGIVEGVTGSTDFTQITNKPTLISGSSQLTSSFDTRYVASGSISAVPAGTISGSSQLTSSFDTRYALSASFVSSSNLSSIQTITSASYAALTPVSGTLYIIIG